MFEHFGCRELPSLCDLKNFIVSKANNDVLRFEISMNDLAHTVHVVKANQTLASQLSHKGKWHTFVVIALNDFKEVNSQNLENHDEVLSVRSVVDKGIQKLHAVRGISTHAILFQTSFKLRVVFVEGFN